MIWNLDHLRLTGFVSSSLDQGALEAIFRRVTGKEAEQTVSKKVPPITLLTGESSSGARAEVRGLTDRLDVVVHLDQLSVTSERLKEIASSVAPAFDELQCNRIALAVRCAKEFPDRQGALQYLKRHQHAWLQSVPDQAEDVLVRLNIKSKVGNLTTNRLVEWSVSSVLMLELASDGHKSRNSFLTALSLDLNNPPGSEGLMSPSVAKDYWNSLTDEAERIMDGQY